MIITIDGLAVNGKTTLAKMISKELNFKNFNTGIIYRCLALEIIRNNIDINDVYEIEKKLFNLDIDFDNENVILNGEDVSDILQTEKISYYSTKWATITKIKELVSKIQKNFIIKHNTVMEGRDIGTRIAPNADKKFYLYSDFEVRVERLWKKNINLDMETIRNDLRIRDELDINCGNFIKPQNAIEIDTSNYSIDEVYKIMMNEIRN